MFTFTGGVPDYGEYSNDKYEAVKDKTESGLLRIKNLEPEDSGLYFCAVSRHSAEHVQHYLTKRKAPGVVHLFTCRWGSKHLLYSEHWLRS